MTRTEDLSDDDPREIGRALLAEFGFSSDQFGCLDSLWTRESNWTWNADNPSSSAYGIPQALPGSKMSSAGADWATNPVTQIRWGLGYIQDRYGSPCSAWGHSESVGWY
ncbi:MAG: lytic transglycosylase domain-containing protein, partial [Nocardioides sp.]